MSRLLILLNIFLIFIAATSLAEHSSNSNSKPKPKQKPHTFVLPVSKDTHEGQYYTSLTVGKPPLTVNLTVDVRGRYLWFHCGKIGYNTTTYTPIHCQSPKCTLIDGGCLKCIPSNNTLPYGPSCRFDTCTSYIERYVYAPIVEDEIILSYTSPSAYMAPKIAAGLPLSCAYSEYHMAGLRSGSSGVLGLGKTPISFVNELVSSYKIPFKVALCLPSKPGIKDSGNVYIGGGPYMLGSSSKDVSGLLVSTPLFRDIGKIIDVDDGYYIDVKSIQVNGKTLSINKTLLTFNETSQMGGTKIETLTTCTYLETSIYKALLKAFTRNAKKRKAVAPFTNCFSSTSFGGKKTPVITLVLGGGAKWKIYGPNSLVKVSKSVVCLGFIDRGLEPIVSIEIGGNLLENHLVEFDLEASKFSFTPSLLLHNTSCSHM